MLQGQRHTAHRQQHRTAGDEVAEQMGLFLPQRINAEQQGQQQAAQVEHHRSVFTHAAIVAVEVGLGIQQEIGDVNRDHQEQFTLASIHRAVGAAEQQHQGGQHVEQRGEEDAEVLDVRSREPGQQQQQRREKMAETYSGHA